MDDDEDTKQLPLVKDETRGGRRHPQKQGSAIDLDIGELFLFHIGYCSFTSKLGKKYPLIKFGVPSQPFSPYACNDDSC